MALDPIDPRPFSLSPEQRAADKFATLDRRVSVAERSSLNIIARNRILAEALGEVSTSSASYVDLGGPSITVNVPAGAFVSIFFAADLHITSAAGNLAKAGITEATDIPAPAGLVSSTSVTYESLVTVPGNSGGIATNLGILGGDLRLPATAGTRTYAVRYQAFGGAPTVFFRNRRLWVEVI